MNSGGLYHWCTAEELQLAGDLGFEWNMYIERLIQVGVFLSDCPDKLVWKCNKTDGNVNAKLDYEHLLMIDVEPVERWWISWVWNAAAPLKSNFLVGCV